jgi:transcriptional regulator with GAF, ATPase, and Fis domain
MAHTREERAWPEQLAAQMQLVANVFANALERKRADAELREALETVSRLQEKLAAENVELREELGAHHVGDLVVESPPMKEVVALAQKVAKTDATALILGETGTGKERLARLIHDASTRQHRRLVVVNCAALPSTLVESELFGHEKGAFTGAVSRQIGRFELAHGSTLFLDEIGELPLEAQAKLLRVLQEGTLERVGSTESRTVDVRFIAATNRDLAEEVRAGRFRQDLYFRLNVFPIHVPPLRERREDIPPLVAAFISELGEKMGKRIKGVNRTSIEALQRHQWPGNVRQLRNTIERAMILAPGPTLVVPDPGGAVVSHLPGLKLADVEREHILAVLARTRWRVRGQSGAAELLGLKPSTLESRMAKLGIRRPGKDP